MRRFWDGILESNKDLFDPEPDAEDTSSPSQLSLDDIDDKLRLRAAILGLLANVTQYASTEDDEEAEAVEAAVHSVWCVFEYLLDQQPERSFQYFSKAVLIKDVADLAETYVEERDNKSKQELKEYPLSATLDHAMLIKQIESITPSFPVLGARESPKTIPLEFIAQYEQQARHNHGNQSIDRLKERGGLSWNELCAVINGTEFMVMDEYRARMQVIKCIEQWLTVIGNEK